MNSTGTIGASLREGDRRDWQRHPVDVARLVVRLCLLGFVLVLTWIIPDALISVSTDFVSFFARMPDVLRYGFIGLAQLAILILPAITVGWLLLRRTRMATLLVIGSGVVSALVMVLLTDWINRVAPPVDITDVGPSEPVMKCRLEKRCTNRLPVTPVP